MSQVLEDREETASPEEEVQTETAVPRRLPRWKIVLVSLALLMGVAGMVLHPQSPSGIQETRTVGNLSASGADPLPDSPAFQSDPVPAFDPTFDMMEETAEEPLPPDWERRLKEETCPASADCWRTGFLFEDWSPLLTKLGFSFVVGFSIGYVLLIFLRTTAFLAGLVLLALFGLQYLGVLYLNWQNIETSYQSVLSWVLPRAENFRDFITHNLSSSGMAAMGILTGLTRR